MIIQFEINFIQCFKCEGFLLLVSSLVSLVKSSVKRSLSGFGKKITLHETIELANGKKNRRCFGAGGTIGQG